MRTLKRLALVQFYLHECEDILIDGPTAFLGENGSGKTSTLDAIQIAMLGAHQRYKRYNAQSVSSKDGRTLSGYCLGLLRNPEDETKVVGSARHQARTYITLVFQGDKESDVISAGLCIEATEDSSDHDIKGLYILPGQDIRAADCVVRDQQGERPMLFNDFRDAARERAKGVGRTATFTDKPEEYVSELLYALSGTSMPDTKRFMSAFVKSMTLKNVDSIDQFVREYVVAPHPIDISSFKTQVEQFKRLREIIRKTKDRIGVLMGILKHFDTAARRDVKAVSLSAIQAVFRVEWLGEKIDKLEEAIEDHQEGIEKARHKKVQAEADLKSAGSELLELQVKLKTDQTEQRKLSLEEKLNSSKQVLAALVNPTVNRCNRLIVALRGIDGDRAFSLISPDISSVLERLKAARNSDSPGVSVATELEAIAPQLVFVRKAADSALQQATLDKSAAAERKKSIDLQIQAAGKTGRLLNAGPATLLDILQQNGIEAQPVSALASISDPSWAPALEAYLGNDRDALVVIEGNTQDAVRLLREARRQKMNVNGAAIVQPKHLDEVGIGKIPSQLAASVFAATNETALRFLRQKFGTMQLVETEAELEIHKRSITRDGMLSQSGLTKSINVLQDSQLRFGKEATDTSAMVRELMDLGREVSRLDNKARSLNELIGLLSPAGDGDAASAKDVAQAEKVCRDTEAELAAVDVSHLDEIKEDIEKAEDRRKTFADAHEKLVALESQLGEKINAANASLALLSEQMPALQEDQQEAMADVMFDAELFDTLKDKYETDISEYRDRLERVEKDIAEAEKARDRHRDTAHNELGTYIRDHSLDVQLEQMSWNERHQWADDEKEKLNNTELHRYEAEAETARMASEEALRTDIAMNLHDRFNEMNLERRDLNRILKTCPPFTGGERYQFEASVVPQYEALVRHINDSAKNDQTLTLFSEDQDDVDETFRGLVDAAAEGADAETVLDFRQFYTFDLAINVGDQRVDRMSTRQGAGSNGEHIAPMYVAAGAALSKAYRIKNKKGLEGFGLICLDEAFHGMDTTNAIATARFFESIGLQMIMAAPESERSKFTPIARTIYDIDREGLDFIMERTTFKGKAGELLVSDMPDHNPEVMPNAFAQLGLTPSEPSEAEQETPPTAENTLEGSLL